MTISRNLSFLAEGVSSTGVLGVSNGGSGATTLTGYLYGNGTSAFTASTTIPTSALSGTISNAQLANSSLTVNGTSISLGGSGTVTAAAGTLTGTTLNSTVVSSSLTSVGTLTSGTWNASTIGATYGGTGQNTVTTGDLLYGSASNTWSKLGIGSTGTILRVVGGVPTWGTDYTGTVTSVAASVPSFLSISGSPITTSGTLAITYSGTALPIANGGTAQTSFTAGQVLYGSFSQSANLYFDGTNLGVGTSSPSTYGKMAVVGSGTNTISAIVDTTGYALLSTQNSGGTTYFGMDNSSGGSFGLGAYARIIYSSGAYPLAISVNGASRLYIGSSGGVSIGNTTDPGAGNLSVNGNITAGTNGIQAIGLPTGSVIQVVNATYSGGQVSTTSTSFVSASLSATITPKFSTSKILVLVNTTGYPGSTNLAIFTIYRGSTNLSGSSTYGLGAVQVANNWSPVSMSCLDSPATTSSTTYTVYFATSSSGIVYSNFIYATSVITLIEVR